MSKSVEITANRTTERMMEFLLDSIQEKEKTVEMLQQSLIHTTNENQTLQATIVELRKELEETKKDLQEKSWALNNCMDSNYHCKTDRLRESLRAQIFRARIPRLSNADKRLLKKLDISNQEELMAIKHSL